MVEGDEHLDSRQLAHPLSSGMRAKLAGKFGVMLILKIPGQGIDGAVGRGAPRLRARRYPPNTHTPSLPERPL